MNNKIEDFLNAVKLGELLHRKEEKKKNTIVCILAVIGAIATVAAIAYAVYRYFTPDYLEDFEDDFEDDFDEDDEDEEETKSEKAHSCCCHSEETEAAPTDDAE